MAMTMEDATDLLPRGAMLIGDSWVPEGGAGDYVHVNPSTGEAHPPIPLAGAADVARAVSAARTAMPDWQAVPANERRRTLLRLASLVEQHAGTLAALTVLDNGSPYFMAMAGPMAAVDNFTYYAGWADKIGGDVVPTWPVSAFDYTLSEPYGVVGVIIPWNVPMHNVGQVLGAALAAGNCVVIKPPELAPFTVLRFGELVLEAGFPAGVVNVLPGGAEAGDALVRHPGIDKVHFIGGAATARTIMAAASESLKPLTFELGGKSANLIFADADLKAAAGTAVGLGLAQSGQGCILPTRVLVEDSVYDEVVDRMVAIAGSMSVGDPFAPGTAMGPVISEASCIRVLGVIEQAKRDGAGTLLTGGERVGDKGFFVAPTIFGDVDNSSELARNEIFGPVLSVMRFSSEDEALAIANDTPYGLAAYLNTNDLRRAHRVARRLEAGCIYANGFSGIPTAAPFGGFKQSGFGRMGGRAGLDDFLRVKNVYIPLT